MTDYIDALAAAPDRNEAALSAVAIMDGLHPVEHLWHKWRHGITDEDGPLQMYQLIVDLGALSERVYREVAALGYGVNGAWFQDVDLRLGDQLVALLDGRKMAVETFWDEAKVRLGSFAAEAFMDDEDLPSAAAQKIFELTGYKP